MMARARPPKPHIRSGDRPASGPHKPKIPHKAVILSLLLAAIPFAMGKYFEFNTLGAFDSGAYMYSARRVLDGAVPGVDEMVTAKAGTLLANMLGISLFGYYDHSAKMIQMLLQAAALVTMFFVVRRVFGGLAGGLAVFVASFYLSAPVIAKFGNVKEQYLIAFAILGVSMLLMRQMGGRWWWGLLAGAFLSWSPLFKATGVAAVFATMFFLLLQPLLRNQSWKSAAKDLVLIIVGGVLAIAPVHIWIMAMGSPITFNPYVVVARYVWGQAAEHVRPAPRPAAAPVSEEAGGEPEVQAERRRSSDYLEGARELFGLYRQAPVVLRYYLVMILPVSLGLGACIVRLVRWLMRALGKLPPESVRPYEKFVSLLGMWWILDMAFVWISPRSWEEYYLPLCASGAMAGGYLAGLYRDKLRLTLNKPLWLTMGAAAFICMVVMGWQIFFGLRTSPFSGVRYRSPSRGYIQRFKDIASAVPAPWEMVAHYIRDNSQPTDTIYVWGWYPGIYVESQRMSASAKLPFTSESHVILPYALKAQVLRLLEEFRQNRPKFLVDTRKNDFPWNRPPLEFWPWHPEAGFLPNDPRIVQTFEAQWYELLKETFGPDDAERFVAMKPLRDYVMANYHVVSPETYRPIPPPNMAAGRFGIHVLLRRNADAE
ncbi:MAG TPA: glycosyltransferase family 39 protein [Sedimentisphaerales bacterium]|nr:glycosyltransferase family 39 protein [Sedimentisphaerales bacterium]